MTRTDLIKRLSLLGRCQVLGRNQATRRRSGWPAGRPTAPSHGVFPSMHGRARVVAPEPEEERLERLKKIAKYCKISDAVLSMRRAGVQNAESLGLTQKILEINPEFYTLWNYRREIIQTMMTAGDLTASSVGESEKGLTQLALEKNPKSYCAWHHRRWVAEQGCVDLGEELATCTKFLNLDARNFHCWDYRRFIAKRANVASADEFAYTSTKIEQNFSNFSAWHYRSRLMPAVFHEKSELLAKIEDEFKLIQQAFYTEPDDQSAWLYHRWLLLTSKSLMETEQYALTLERELATCDELLSIEPDCKQAMLAVVLMLQQLIALHPATHGDSAALRVVEIFARLRELDPVRVNYYNEMQAAKQQSHLP